MVALVAITVLATILVDSHHCANTAEVGIGRRVCWLHVHRDFTAEDHAEARVQVIALSTDCSTASTHTRANT